MTQRNLFELITKVESEAREQRKEKMREATKGATMAFESQDITFAHHHGDEFSMEANRSIKHVKAQLRDKVYIYIKSRGAIGSTSEECELALNMSHTTIGPRFTELKALDRIKLTGKRPNKSGRSAGVYVA